MPEDLPVTNRQMSWWGSQDYFYMFEDVEVHVGPDGDFSGRPRHL